MSMRRFLLLLSAAATLICPGCFKDVSDSTNYVLKPLVQNLSADPNNPLEGFGPMPSWPTRRSIRSPPTRMP